jgi:prepilin-type N-terminal cleavage/methylation domain-containing protein
MKEKASGFSLIELSIVLVILGLLTGGILAGQSLIRASELRAVSSEFQRYQAAIHSFRDKYMGIPGDFRDATRFWLRTSTTGCNTNSSAAVGSPGTCDGDGGGYTNNTTGGSVSGEQFQFWRQMALAGLIEGDYSGYSSSTGASGVIVGTNVPRSRISNGAWWSTADSPNGYSTANYMNSILISALNSSGDQLGGALLKPEEAWNIDTKLDDGKPAYGKVLSRSATSGCAVPDDGSAAAANKPQASYSLSNNSILCALHLVQIW